MEGERERWDWGKEWIEKGKEMRGGEEKKGEEKKK